jgi:glycosyltransferase involved in cell wall biosynthesis
MLHNKRIAVVLPAFRAAATLRRTYDEIPHDIVDDVLLVDDASDDQTVEVARQLGIETYVHSQNLGYGANQKTCYRQALQHGADIIVMLHPDYQYDPRLVTAMSAMIASGTYDVVLGSRILGNSTREGGMPRYKYYANRILTAWQNLWMGTKLSEFHTGYRAFSRPVLERLPLLANSNDFIFDNQMIAQIVWHDHTIAEISCPTKYFPEASSINFQRSSKYGIGCLLTGLSFRLARMGLLSMKRFPRRT